MQRSTFISDYALSESFYYLNMALDEIRSYCRAPLKHGDDIAKRIIELIPKCETQRDLEALSHLCDELAKEWTHYKAGPMIVDHIRDGAAYYKKYLDLFEKQERFAKKYHWDQFEKERVKE